MAVDRPEEVPGGLGDLLRLPHPAAYLDRLYQATKLKSGLPAEGVKLFTDYGHFDNIAYDQTMQTAFADVIANSIRKNGNPEAALDACDKKVNVELKKLFG